MDDTLLLEKYFRFALNNFSNVLSQGRNYQFKCNVCGDGKKKTQKRGHLRLYNQNGESYYYYKCFNEGCLASYDGKAWSGQKWLKYTSPVLHSQYVKELLTNNEEDFSYEKLPSIKKEVPKKASKELSFYDIFKPIQGKEELFSVAIKYCEQRKIPKEIYKKWKICIEGKYANRLIIPFYDDKDCMYYFQGRTLKNQEPKYLNKEGSKNMAIYNIYHINKTFPVHILEGPIDSLFIQNSIAIVGLALSQTIMKILNKLNCRWILDNDESGIKKSKMLLKKANYVFLWKEFLKDIGLEKDTKDFNEVVIKTNKTFFQTNELDKYFTNSFYDIIRL